MLIINYKRGFTLIELIVVISIIAVLASLAYMSISGETSHARDAKRVSDLKTIENSLAISAAQNQFLTFTNEIGSGNGSGDKIVTTTGDIRVIRGAKMMNLVSGVVNSDIIAEMPRDPNGSYYLGAFINQKLFQIIGINENADTERPLAVIYGSFKESVVIDNLLIDIDNNDRVILVANPAQFIRGDLIKIDDEVMKVDDISIESANAGDRNILLVTRAQEGTMSVKHLNRAKVKIIKMADSAQSLVCLGSLATLTKSATNLSGVSDNLMPSGFSIDKTAVSLEDVYTCASDGVIEHEGTILPYSVK